MGDFAARDLGNTLLVTWATIQKQCRDVHYDSDLLSHGKNF